MLTYNSKVAQETKRIIEERIFDLVSQMAVGLLTHEEYKKSAGQIAGLREAIDFLSEAESNIDGNKRS